MEFKKESHCRGYNVRSVLVNWLDIIDSEEVFGILPKKEYLVTITEYKLKRSIAQNKLMWLWIGVMCDYTGYEKHEFHAYVNEAFVVQEEKEIMGKLVNTSKTTSKLNTKEFSEMLRVFESHVIDSDVDVVLPHPSDLYDYAVYGIKPN